MQTPVYYYIFIIFLGNPIFYCLWFNINKYLYILLKVPNETNALFTMDNLDSKLVRNVSNCIEKKKSTVNR